MTPGACLRLCLALGVLPATVLGQKVEIQYDHDADFSRYRTFAIRQGYLNSHNPALNSDIVRRGIEDAIRTYLLTCGMRETAGAPDLSVRFSLGGANPVAVRHGEGTLIIDLRDQQKRDLVWRSIASGASNIERDVSAMVRKAIEKYPPKRY